MPGYGLGQTKKLPYNRQAYLWQNESVAASAGVPSLSVAVQLERFDGPFYPWGASFELWFSAAPGAFEVDILGANTDNPVNYIQLGSIIGGTTPTGTIAGGFVYRYDMASNLWPTYVCAYMKTLTNAVNVSLQVTR